MTLWNSVMNFHNQYNVLESELYVIGGMAEFSGIIYPKVASNSLYHIPTPVGTNFTFYAIPKQQGAPIIDNFWVQLYYSIDGTTIKNANIQLTGPIGFNVIPEPTGICLFALGTFFLKFLIKRN